MSNGSAMSSGAMGTADKDKMMMKKRAGAMSSGSIAHDSMSSGGAMSGGAMAANNKDKMKKTPDAMSSGGMSNDSITH
jgi:hypothetical protein